MTQPLSIVLGWMLVQVKETIAKILMDPKTKQIIGTTFYKRNFRFKCKRCAAFCCKLGGPNLTEKDVQRIKKAGYIRDDFLNLGKRDDGSCIFLRFDDKLKVYECSIYDIRPALCRIYPFHFERIDSNSFLLKFIPCCMGLNGPDGELVDERFISNHLLDTILEIFNT